MIRVHTISAPSGNLLPIPHRSMWDGRRFFTRAKPRPTMLSSGARSWGKLQETKTKMSKKNNANVVAKAAINEALGLNPTQWTGSMSGKVLRASISNLTGADQQPIALTPFDDDVIELIVKPTRELQVRLLKRIVAAHGGTMDADTEKTINRVVSAPAFNLELIKAGKIKGTDDGGLNDLLG
jgi:hypothetical protein